MKIANVLIVALMLCTACKNSTEKETPNGFKYTVVEAGDGVLPKKEEIVVFDFIMKDSKDSIWSNTREAGMPGVVMIADSSAMASEDGMTQMFRMLSKGDSVTVNMPITKFFKDLVKSPLPPGIDSTLSLGYYIQVKDIMKMDAFRAYQTTLMEQKKERQKVKDSELITEYLSDNKITAQQDTSGIKYVIHNTTGGKKPTVGNCVEVKYTGRFLKNGQVFDKNEKISFPLAGVIAGWQIGIPMLGIGDSATFYIPSDLAYGPQGYPGAIPPDAILIFDVALLNIGEVDPATRNCK